MFLCLHPRPGYQEGTSIWNGMCMKKGSNRMPRSQQPATIPCKIIEGSPSTGAQLAIDVFPLLPYLRDRVHSLERKTTCVDSHKACRFQSSNSRYKMASWSNHPVRGKEIGAIRRKVFLQDSWPYEVAIWAEDTNRGVHLDAGGGILRIGNVGKGYPSEGRSDGTRDRRPPPRHSSN